MAEYLPNVRFNRRGHVNSQHESSTWFAWTYTLESLSPPEFIVNGNYGAMTVLRDSFRKYIINTPIQNTTLGIEILYTDHPDQVKPKRIFIVKRVREGQPAQEFKIVNTVRLVRRHRQTAMADLPFERSGTVFRNNELRDIVKKLRRKNILQISLCEVYNDDGRRTRDGREYKPFTMEVQVLYRNIPSVIINSIIEPSTEITIPFNLERSLNEISETGDRVELRRVQQELLNYYLQLRTQLDPRDTAQQTLELAIRHIRDQLNTINPNQLQVVPAPNPVPEITSKSYPDVCMICQDSVVGEGCRVNCDAGHIYHCDCINGWRNSRAGNEFYDTNWHDNCPICRQPIDSMYHVDIPEGFTTGFGRKRTTRYTGLDLKTINKWMKYLNTF